MQTAPHYPVSARYTPDGWESTGLSFGDYERCHVFQHKQHGERRLPTPRWAIDDGLLRELLVCFMEERAGIRPEAGRVVLSKLSLEQRLASAQQVLQRQRQFKAATMAKLCKEYVALKQSTLPDRKEMRKLEIQIENLDTCVRTMEKDGGTAVVAGIVKFYYSVGLDSPGVGQELGIKPTHARQVLWRLFKTAAVLAATNPRFAEALGDVAATKAATNPRFAERTSRPKPGIAFYRCESVQVLEVFGELAKIRNKLGIITVEIKALEFK